MSKSKIEWTEKTWNPVTGCTKVSSGCKNCYAERDWVRSLRDQCADAGVPFMFKQWGSYAPISTATGIQILPFGQYNPETKFGFKKMNKKNAGRILDRKLHDEYPNGGK